MTFLDLPADVLAYCDAVNLAPSTVCVRAVGDSRYLTRHQKRIEALQRDEQKLRDFMRANPPKADAAA